MASPSPSELELAKSDIERLNRELASAQQERSQSAAYGLELLNERENLQKKYDALLAQYEQSKHDLHELREAWNKTVSEQRISATTVFEKEVQLLNDSDALAASFSLAKQEIEKELSKTKTELEETTAEKDRLLLERDELAKKLQTLEAERKQFKSELKELKSRETKLFNENGELEEENVSLQKQVSNLRCTQVEFESSKHEIQRLQDDNMALNSKLEEMVTLRRITERQMREALEALESEREQKYALRKELDKRNSADPSLLNLTSLAALKSSPHLANLALRGLNLSHRSSQISRDENVSPNGFSEMHESAFGGDSEVPAYDALLHDPFDMPSIEGSLFDEVHMTEIKKLQQDLEDKESQRSILNTKLIDIQHKLESKSRQADVVEKKLLSLSNLIEDTYNDPEIQRVASCKTNSSSKNHQQQQPITDDSSKVSSSTKDEAVSAAAASSKPNAIDDFDNIYSHLQTLFGGFRLYLDRTSELLAVRGDEAAAAAPASLVDAPESSSTTASSDKSSIAEPALQSDDVESLRSMLYKKQEQLKQMRTVLKSNKESAEVALKNLKTKYDMDRAIVTETMQKLREEHKRLNEDAATFASLRSHFSARIEEYNSEIEKLQAKLTASENEKITLNSILRMAIEQKVMLNQKLEAMELDREDQQYSGGANNNGAFKSGPHNNNGGRHSSANSRSRGSYAGYGGRNSAGRGGGARAANPRGATPNASGQGR